MKQHESKTAIEKTQTKNGQSNAMAKGVEGRKEFASIAFLLKRAVLGDCANFFLWECASFAIFENFRRECSKFFWEHLRQKFSNIEKLAHSGRKPMQSLEKARAAPQPKKQYSRTLFDPDWILKMNRIESKLCLAIRQKEMNCEDEANKVISVKEHHDTLLKEPVPVIYNHIKNDIRLLQKFVLEVLWRFVKFLCNNRK